MGKIITENFRVDIAKELIESLETENYYAVASRCITKTEHLSADPIANTQFSKREFQRKVVFGKKLKVLRRGIVGGTGSGQQEAKYMFLDNPWEEGRVYDAYDDTQDIENLNMIVSVQEDSTGNFIILKCIDNNNGAQSRDVAAEIDSESYSFFEGADGYVWHPMFTVTADEAETYRTAGSLPVAEFVQDQGGYGDYNIVTNAQESISRIVIETTKASQFNQYLFGPATSIHNASDVKIENPDSSSVSSSIKKVVVSASVVSGRSLYTTDNAYKNMYLRDKNNGKLYDVLASKTLLASNSIVLDIETTDTFVAQELYQLVLKVDVTASTLTGRRCTAYGKLDQFGTLVGIGFYDRGTEYKYAEANIIYPAALKNSASVRDNPTVLRPVVSPKGGHGSDPINEMATSKVTMVSVFNGESAFVPDGNDYSIVGLLKNPTFTDPVTGNVLTPPDEFDNRTILEINGNVTVGGTGLSGGGVANQYVCQYIETIDIQDAVDGVSYTIVDKGNITQDNDWSTIGATTSSDVGAVFTAQNLAQLDNTKTAKVSFARDAVDTTDTEYDYSIEIIEARIHEINYDGSSKTRVYLVDYYGGHRSKFQIGKFYIKDKPTSTSFINNKSCNNIVYGQYDPYSGDLLHFIDFSPIPRSPDKNEKVKFTFDF